VNVSHTASRIYEMPRMEEYGFAHTNASSHEEESEGTLGQDALSSRCLDRSLCENTIS